MPSQFQVSTDARGDILAADGAVIDRSTGTVFIVGANDGHAGVGGPAPTLDDAQEIPGITGSVLLGGSGRNVIVSGHGGALDGIYRPERPGFWSKGGFVLEVTDSSAATIRDATDVIAELTTGGLAPGGSYVASSYGETTYNGSTAFTLTGTKEDGWPGAPNSIELTISEGLAQGGIYTTTDGVNYVSDADANWTLVVNADGTADLKYLTEIIATRDHGDGFDPCGEYLATAAGKMLNPEFSDELPTDESETNPFGVLTIVYSWSGSPDLDTTTKFLNGDVGYPPPDIADYMTFTGDNTSTGEETVTIDLAAAWDDGVISTHADVLCMADWYPSGSSGPATLTVSYSLGGTPSVSTIFPGPGPHTPASTQVAAIRVTAAGAYAPTGADWKATVRAIRKFPTEGVVYIAIASSGGAITGVTGPIFAATLPTSGGGTFYYTLATSDGAGKLTQVHAGPLLWSA